VLKEAKSSKKLPVVFMKEGESFLLMTNLRN